MKDTATAIDNLVLRERWIDEGVEPPSDACKTKAKNICALLYECYDILPEEIDATKEGGVYISYRDIKRTLDIEVYNDLDIAVILADDREIIAAKDGIVDNDPIVEAFVKGVSDAT